ncbi:hypothetical protein [Burkholderia ubonensis]|uniref:hypothetical protein n=1 Tax=Burkholderia ubonensis TaxID=101571 RepID=UPI00075B152A|nr:hypothetical protein [Burkholderia ubonensis]KWK75744.1 hypothetical protein WM15_29545 [Burkholderia ubonensis]
MIDVKKLRELAQALPQGDFSVWTSNSWRRIYIGDAPAITPCIQRYDNQPDLSFGEGVKAFIEAIGAQTILALCDRLEAAEIRCDELLFDNEQLQSGATAEAMETSEWRSRAEAAEKDAARLDWVMHRLSGKALRDIGVIYSEGNPAATRAAIDAAIAQRQEGSRASTSTTCTDTRSASSAG